MNYDKNDDKTHESWDMADIFGPNIRRPPELPELDLPDASEAADESLSPGSSCQGGANARDEGHVPLGWG